MFLARTSIPMAAIMILLRRRKRESVALAVVLYALNVVLQRMYRLSSTGRRQYVPVGSGWSFFLNKTPLDGLPLYAPSGRLPNGRWGAGTMIKHVQSALVRQGLTLSSYPSIESGTLGAWIASGSHGSGGTLWKGNFAQVLVRDLASGEERLVPPSLLFHKRATIEACRAFLILEVEITPHPNVWCKKMAHKMMTEEDYAEFITCSSYLRMLQIGQRGVMRLLWVPLEKGDDELITHTDPHLFSQTGLWLQSDILSILQSNRARDLPWFEFPVEPRRNFTSRIRLADANMYTKEPTVLTTPIGLLWINFEVFVHDYYTTAPELHRLSNVLRDLFEVMWGRCELRLGKGILFLDFNIYRNAEVGRVFETLYDTLGPVDITLHRGKAQVDTAPFVPATKP